MSTQPAPAAPASVDRAGLPKGAPRRRLPLLIGAGVLVVAGTVVAVVLGTRSSASAPHGARTPQLALSRFLAAINAGDQSRALQLSCVSFADGARQAAVSGADPGITFAASGLQVGAGNATATLAETFDVGGTKQTSSYLVRIDRSGGTWQVCGFTPAA